jgi:hypothetical protein
MSRWVRGWVDLLYSTLPITGPLYSFTAWPLVLGLLGFAGVVTWQVRAVLRSQYPPLRAIEALAAAIPLFLLLFAAATSCWPTPSLRRSASL